MIYYQQRKYIIDIRQSCNGNIYTLQHRLYIEADFDKPVCNPTIICAERRPRLHVRSNWMGWFGDIEFECCVTILLLTHRGRVIHMSLNRTIVGADTTCRLVGAKPLYEPALPYSFGWYFCEIWIKQQVLKKTNFKMSFAKYTLFCLRFSELHKTTFRYSSLR